jgi:hypothetical protein
MRRKEEWQVGQLKGGGWMKLRKGVMGLWLGVLCVLALGLAPAAAEASRPLLEKEVLHSGTVPGGGVEGACGVAAVGSSLYVSDYYRRRVDLFSGHDYVDEIAVGYNNVDQIDAPNPLDGVCGLALTGGALYANEWHGGVSRLLPSFKVFGSGHESTAVAADAAGNVYVSNRTYVAVYQPSAAPVLHEGLPLKIGLGDLGDAYGVAVSAGRTYVADAATGTVKVFEAAGDPDAPVAEFDPGFVSLVDGALAIDPTNGHLLVLDNLQPGYESPEAAIDEFSSTGVLLDHITASGKIIDGEPSGLTVDSGGNLYVTSGNSEGSNVFKFGAYVAAAPLSAAPAAAAAPAARGAASGASALAGDPPAPRAGRRPGATASEVVQRDHVRVSVQAKLAPKKLPRKGAAPVRFDLDAKIASTDESVPPQLREIEIAINRYGHLDPTGLPTCRIDQIQPSTTEGALEVCGRSVVGEGLFTAKVLLTQQAPFPSRGKIVAFNGSWHGHPAILAHVFGTEPVPTSYTLPFVIGKIGKGTYGTVLKASLPRFTSKWGYVTGISLGLGRGYSGSGAGRRYLTAGCPAPKGTGIASFPLARATLSFGKDGPGAIGQTLIRSCGVR